MKFLLNYSFFYKLYQTFFGANKARRILLREYIKSDGNKRVLDLCCGTCDILPYLDFFEYIGVDSSEKYIDHCKRKFTKFKNTAFISEDVGMFLNKTSSSGAKFDIVLLLGGMHHIDDNSLINILQGIQKQLAPDGRLITIDGCFEPHLSRFMKMLLANDRGRFVRTKDEWVKIFTSVFKDYKYDVRANLYHIPYNVIIFYK
jgi:SAM-dependent methyltransferase